MTAVCISSTRGVDVVKSANYTIATSAPTTNFDFELRFNLLDANSAPLTKKDIILFLENLAHLFENPNTKAFFSTSPTGTNFTGPQI
jgi:hypothetical protein